MASKGGDYGWVKSYTIAYSKDNIIWNKIQDQNTGQPKVFLANVDSENMKKVHFAMPINARYIKVQPTKWRDAIELKLEPIGCFLPYLLTTSEYDIFSPNPSDETLYITSSPCGLCKGVLPPPRLQGGACYCHPPKYWDGEECVTQAECPCVEGYQFFPVGVTYQTENCDTCTCQLGGTAKCIPKKCEKCKEGYRRVKPDTCNCKCEKCPDKMVLCKTSGQCIDEQSWCDNVVDCPDDEIDCTPTVPPILKHNETITVGEFLLQLTTSSYYFIAYS